jgi:hypothetical protein
LCIILKPSRFSVATRQVAATARFLLENNAGTVNPLSPVFELSPGGHTVVPHHFIREEYPMSKKATEQHKQAAEQHTHAARHHSEAAKHHDAGHHEKAAHHAHLSRAHAVVAGEHADHAAKAHIEDHGKK